MEGFQGAIEEPFLPYVPTKGQGGWIYSLAADEDDCAGIHIEVHGAFTFCPCLSGRRDVENESL